MPAHRAVMANADTATSAAGSSLSGAGTLTFRVGVHAFAAGQFNPTGTVNFSGHAGAAATIILGAGQFNLPGTVNFGTSFGPVTTLTGEGDLTINGKSRL